MDDERLTTCPICSGPLVQGKLNSGLENYFLPDGEKRPIWYTKKSIEMRNGVKLAPDSLERLGGKDFPSCCLCRNCRMIFLPCP